MNKTKNPYIDSYEYFNGYKDNIDNLKNNPEMIELDKLCYELFEMNPQGKTFIDFINTRYLLPALVNLSNPNYTIACVWAEGFKEAFRTIKNCVKSHEQRIKAETNK